MRKNISLAFQIAAVFIGTIVGAGLASGQEIRQFFTEYGYKGFYGILVCCILYIFIGCMVSSISIRFNLNSYNELINLVVRPKILGKITDAVTGLFLISGAAIILAASGSLLHQYFQISSWIGILIMASTATIILLRDTKGLLEVNSLIVPSLIIVIVTIFTLYILFYKDIVSVSFIKTIPNYKNNWFISCILYSGFNILGCSGVLVPLSREIKSKSCMFSGIAMGAVVLTFLSLIINLLLLLNIPYIFKYDIPLLYVSNRFGKLIQLMLLCIIWLEMFTTEISDVYSVGKTMEKVFKIPYRKSVILILLIAIPISQIGFVNLISILYPAFGMISILFIVQCVIFFFRNK